MKPCWNCNKEYKTAANFCPYCGSPREQPEISEKPEQSPRDSQSPVRRTSKKYPPWLIPALVAAVAVTIIVLVVNGSHPGDGRSSDVRDALPPRAASPVIAEEPPPVYRPADASRSMRSELLSEVKNYYNSLNPSSYDATRFFAPRVDRYFAKENVTPAYINSSVRNSFFPEFSDPVTKIDPTSFRYTQEGEYHRLNFQSTFTCYRRSKRKYEFARVETTFIFNQDKKIISLYEDRVWDVRFTDNRLAN